MLHPGIGAVFHGGDKYSITVDLHINMMYLYPRCEWRGKRLVWLEYVEFFASYTLMYTSRAIFLGGFSRIWLVAA